MALRRIVFSAPKKSASQGVSVRQTTEQRFWQNLLLMWLALYTIFDPYLKRRASRAKNFANFCPMRNVYFAREGNYKNVALYYVCPTSTTAVVRAWAIETCKPHLLCDVQVSLLLARRVICTNVNAVRSALMLCLFMMLLLIDTW